MQDTVRRLWSFLRTPGKTAQQLRKVLALQCFRREYAWMRSIPVSEPEQGTVLFVNFTDWIPRAKLDGAIAAALRTRGVKPVVLTERKCTWSIRYLRALGIRDFLFFEDFLAEAEKELQSIDLQKLLQEHCSFHGLYRFLFRDIGVGRHVLSTVVRELKGSGASLDDPIVLRMLERCFRNSMRTATVARLLFARMHPDAVLFLEKGYTPYGELFDAALAENLNTIQYFHGHRSDLLVMRRFRSDNRFDHPFALSAASWKKVQALPWTQREEEAFMAELRKSYAEGSWMNRKFLLKGKKLKDPAEMRAQLKLDPRKKTAVIFSHVLWDATFFFGKNLFPDYEQWLIATVRAACENPHVNWLIKLHPDYVWKMKQMGAAAAPRDVLALQTTIGTLPPHIQVVPPETDISTYSFFGITDYCITVRGTIGIEAPCFSIPVFTAGTGRYSGLGFTEDSETPEEYLGNIRHIHEFPALSPERTSLARCHAWALFSLRPLPFRSCEIAPKQGAKTFEQDAVMRVHSQSNLEQAMDLKAFLDWVLLSKEEDYLHLPAETHS